MKKEFLAFILAAGIALSTASCTIKDGGSSVSSPSIPAENKTETNEQGGNVISDPGKEYYTLITRELPYTVKSEDESVIYIQNKLQKPSFVANDRVNSEAASKMNTVLNNAYTRNDEESEKMLKLLQSLDTLENVKATFPWTLNASYEVVRNDGKAISVVENIHYYAGGTHPTQNTYTYNFDPTTGEKIPLVLYPAGDNDARDKAEDMVYNKLVEKYGSEEINYDYVTASIIDEAVDSWHFTDTGIKLIFNEYDIAPYAAGSFQLDIPKEELPEEAQRYFK